MWDSCTMSMPTLIKRTKPCGCQALQATSCLRWKSLKRTNRLCFHKINFEPFCVSQRVAKEWKIELDHIIPNLNNKMERLINYTIILWYVFRFPMLLLSQIFSFASSVPLDIQFELEGNLIISWIKVFDRIL